MSQHRTIPFLPAVLIAMVGVALTISGCKISKHGENGEKRVDIETPVGSIHVNKDSTKASDTGLPDYPGAKLAEDSDHDKSANVNIDTSKFGLKVVAVRMQSDDAPAKVLSFYREKMKSMGAVQECKGSFDINTHGNTESQEIRCHENGGETELMVSQGNRHRSVAVKPNGSGSRIELVYVQARGERETL
jgi:hypothetical protein